MDLKLTANGVEPQQFMSPEEYIDFCERLREKVKPEMDRIRRCHAESEESSRRHFIPTIKDINYEFIG